MAELTRRRIVIDPLEFSSSNKVRTPGLHVTEVIKDMLSVAGIGKKHKTEAEGGYSQDQLRRFQAQGYMWEDAVLELIDVEAFYEDVATGVLKRRVLNRNDYMPLPEVAFNPRTGHAFWVEYDDKGELLCGPIPLGYYLCSPDGGHLELEPIHRFSLVECKRTTKSSRMLPEVEKPEWFYQVKSYLGPLRAVLAYPVNRVEFHVQFPHGDYRGDAPIYEEWEREYSDSEVDDTWAAIDAHARWRAKSVVDHPWRRWL